MRIIKQLSFALISFLVFAFSPFVIRAAYSFSEEFSIDPSISSDWVIDQPLGLSHVVSKIVLSAPTGNKFPFLRTNSVADIASSDSYEFAFKINGESPTFGAGVALTDNVPTYPTTMIFPSIFVANTIFYAWTDSTSHFHIATSLCPSSDPLCTPNIRFVYPNITPSTTLNPLLLADFNQHTIRVTKAIVSPTEYSYQLFLDSNLIFQSAFTARNITNFWIGHPETTFTNSGWPEFEIDYIRTTQPSPSPSPGGSPIPSGSPVGSPAPSVSPVPSGSPVPSVAPSAFPYYSQSDSQWGSQLYDHANKWAEVGKRGIDRWGCALTSAAMVLKQHGVKTLAGLEVTPAALNAWLKGQEDGYIHNGLVNWLALTRYVRQSYNGGQSPTKLEFVKAPYGEGDVSAKLGAGLFPILGEPGHFVASRGEDDTSWQIHDPDDVSRTTLAKSSTLVSSNTFVPSLTDLSYMLFVYDTDMTLTVATAGGTVAGVVTEEYLADDVGGSPAPPVKLHYIAKPPSGMYNLEVTGQGRLDMYLYDEKGSNWTKKLNVKGDGDQIEFRFNRTHVNKTKLEYHYRRMWHYMHKWKRWIWFWHRGRWNDHWWD